MRFDPARWPEPWVTVVVLTIAGSIVIGISTGLLSGPVGGILFGGACGTAGALIWRADAIPWGDIASWTIPLAVWIAVAWIAVESDVAYLIAGAAAVVWFACFIFWLPPVRWWYRRILRKDVP
jgi:hypothetical protein